MLIKVNNPELYARLVEDYTNKGYAPYEARTFAFFQVGPAKK